MSIRVLITLMFFINLLTSPELSLVCTALLRIHYRDMNPHCHSSDRMCYRIWEYRTTLLYSESTYYVLGVLALQLLTIMVCIVLSKKCRLNIAVPGRDMQSDMF